MFAEDLSLFFDVANGFAVNALRTPAGGAVEATPRAVIFDANGLQNADFGVVTQQPAFLVPADTWPTLAELDEFEIGGQNYRARPPYPNRDGALMVVELARIA
jgi:hypothetical protein